MSSLVFLPAALCWWAKIIIIIIIIGRARQRHNSRLDRLQQNRCSVGSYTLQTLPLESMRIVLRTRVRQLMQFSSVYALWTDLRSTQKPSPVCGVRCAVAIHAAFVTDSSDLIHLAPAHLYRSSPVVASRRQSLPVVASRLQSPPVVAGRRSSVNYLRPERPPVSRLSRRRIWRFMIAMYGSFSPQTSVFPGHLPLEDYTVEDISRRT